MRHDTVRANGATVRAIRKARRLLQDELADLAGINPGYLSRIETGKRCPEVGNTIALAVALDVDPEILTGQRPAIHIFREACGVTIDTLAHDIGVDVDRLARVEHGSELLPPELLHVVANRLSVDPEALQSNVQRHHLADAS